MGIQKKDANVRVYSKKKEENIDSIRFHLLLSEAEVKYWLSVELV